MAGGVTIVKNNLGKMAGNVRPSARAVVQKTIAAIEAGAKARSRVDTGQMRAGWSHRMTGETAGEVYNAVEHVVYNEYGTSRMPAQPMATPAAEAARGPFVAAMRKVLGSL